MKWTRGRNKVAISTALLLLGLMLLKTHSRFYNDNAPLRRRHLKGEQKGCHLPRPDPFDPSITGLVLKLEPLDCKGAQVELTYLAEDEWLYVNQTAMAAWKAPMKCYYRCYDRVEGDDGTLRYDEWIQLEKRAKPNCEFVETYCKKANLLGTTVYHNNHNQVLKRNTSATHAPGQRNVVLIVLDSVSHSNFIRLMPKSLEVLKSLYNSYVFDGMSKVGDNTFPNAIAFLSGRNTTEYGYSLGYFDDHPILWKEFAKMGYTTFFAEDLPEFNVFTYLAKGFQRKPTHHYLRPFWLNVYGSYLHRRSKFLCYGNRAIHNIQLEYMSQFLHKFKDSPHFILNWFIELAHDYMNQVQHADKDFAMFLTKHYDLLKNSFLFVFADHGHRFDSIRRTAIGRIEEAFPFFAMHIPEDLRKLPRLDEIVKKNTQVLTTFWDLHETLMAILRLGMSNEWKNITVDTADFHNASFPRRGLSLFSPIPDRNCKEAYIPDEFCMCNYETVVNVNESIIWQLSNSVIHHVNSMLSSYKNCAKLVPSKVLYAALIEDDGEADELDRYRIAVEATPSQGVFEALLKYDRLKNSSAVLGTINRVNSYGNQSACVKNAQLRKYCYCI